MQVEFKVNLSKNLKPSFALFKSRLSSVNKH